MTKFKIGKPLIIIVVVVLVVIIALSPMILLMSGLLYWAAASIIGTWLFTPNPPKPEVTYGEFPFEIVYEIDGEIVTVSDVYVCEYDGIGANEGTGKHRTWKGYFKSTGEETLVLLQDGNLTLACAVGSPEYYMSDPCRSEVVSYDPYIYYIISPNEFGGTSSGVMDIEPLLEQYKIKLISWKLSEPIPNSFE